MEQISDNTKPNSTKASLKASYAIHMNHVFSMARNFEIILRRVFYKIVKSPYVQGPFKPLQAIPLNTLKVTTLLFHIFIVTRSYRKYIFSKKVEI